jgi:CubicO group peptidase (beta-lactamase class C family)
VVEVLVAAALTLALAGDGDRRASCMARNADAPARYAGLVRALCADHHNLGGVGASVAVGEAGSLRFVATAGQRCAGGPDVAADTGFRIGSLTKLWTAALALTVIDDGWWTLDEPVVRALPELGAAIDARAGEVSLRQLLSHSAGLRELWPKDAPDAWLDAVGEQTLMSEPGALWSYSNVGFALAGAALERVFGRSYEVALQERVLAPLGARRTTADLAVALRDGAACGHLGRGVEVMPLDVRADLQLGAGGARWSMPAGGMIAPAGELVTLVLGLVDPVRSPLSARAIEELLRAQIATHERPGEGYALGVRVQTLADGSAMYVHSGNTGDFAAELYLVPARGFALVLLTNTADPLQASAAAGLQELLGVRPTLPGRVGPHEGYVGEYEDDGREITVTAGLSLDGAALEHIGDHRFRIGDDARSTVTFVFADGGVRASHLRGPGFVAARAQAPRWK